MLNGQAVPRHPKAVLDRIAASLLLSSNGARVLLVAATGLALASCAGDARVEYRDCWTATLRDAGARCGHIAAPGSYSDSTRASRRVAFAIKPPLAAPVSGSDPVVFLIGGPGLSATYYSEIDGYDADDLDFLNEDREVILVDYRGLGESGHVNCVPAPGLSDCIAQLNASGLAPELRSSTIVRDIDRLLEALGYQSVVLYGESWGTRLAMTMVREVPERVSHVILDGVLPHGTVHDPITALANLDYLARTCEQNPACTGTLGDVRGKLMTLGERWRDRDRAAELFAGIAAVSHFPAAPLLVHELWTRNADEAAEMAAHIREWTYEVFEDSAIDLAESRLIGMTIICAEPNPFEEPLDPTPYGITGVTLEIIAGHTFGAPVSPEQAKRMCEALPVDPAPVSELEPVFSDIPALVLSGGMDLDTSFAWGELVAGRLSNGRHLVFPFSGHVTVLHSACARSIAAQFIRSPSGALDTGCLDADVARSRELVFSTDDILAEIRKDIPASLSVR
jgi:pimeloyl-ACP methyl ester carboxylesterase